MGIWNIDSSLGEYQNKEATEQYNYMDGMAGGMHESFPKIGESLSAKHGSPDTETRDAHAYISMTPHPMTMSSVK